MAILQRLTAPVALSCAPGFPIVRDAVLDVDDTGRIAWFGPAASAPATDAVVRPLPGLLMPGLVNTHCHTPMSLLRGMGGDLPLMPWLTDVMWPAEGLLTESDVHAGMLAGCLDLLRTGCTTSVEMYFYTDALVDAVRTAGSRAVLTPGIIAAPGWDRLGTWEQMRDDVSARIDAHGVIPDADGRIELGYGPHSAYTLPPGALESVSEAARERGALVHTHVAESRGEDSAVRDSHGSVPAMLDAGGALGGRMLAAHSVHLSDDDIDTYARHGVAVAHCPGSNAKLAAGTARLLDLRRAGVPVGLGTDGPASCDDLDLWHQARLAGLLARVGSDDAAALTAADVLLMGTADAAHAIGRDDLGVLEAGRRADVVHVDTDDSAFVAPEDDAQLVSNLVWAGGSRLVRDVWVGGEQVVAGGEPTMADRRESLTAVRAISARLRETLAR
ncbi:S-adenosylhomocysteine deaminase, Methylthioadenosine deaminase [Pseudonocardia sp. Ae168_Ps1]|uniref:amidohydrolase family protein n=1 Tax=unclassified Pseudonocardia TaxID=2619320 RepID=UPI0009698FD2|nr:MULTISPECIES: amidohydrolase family protein [unclassified Pseudonocardia]OLL74976.1 S-adenosylhomocysteine deaminase Methylthioadenosine deaminase [Pseudonocardia sp. Ae150A_Ps1]OLL80967.1 S-adenosylhomocysteine deaminase, Methylthioadenosine deaminase [Pseudonocardia sp. Ae168_Ps1]OLL84915.1 S-adenosylhomocysteine deaminase, Methylthioadenosine deaminase [Pseudonocardia sp. Ae263_Ps1]OLL95068.1 S-adenosylhomocysteine deaminase, Methylthioadenosine deaminase [Pseudonocardia sp. Ae356_Ps1]